MGARAGGRLQTVGSEGGAGADVFEGIKNVLNNIERLKTSKNNYGMMQ